MTKARTLIAVAATVIAGCAQTTAPETTAAPASATAGNPATGAPPAAPAPSVAARETPIDLGSALVSADVSMTATDGSVLTLAKAATDKGLLVVFTCNHCPWAKAWEQRIVDLGNTYREKGIGVVAVNSNDPTDHAEDDMAGMKARVAATGMKFPYVVDATSDVARAYGATKTPEVFLFDGTRKLVYYGAVDDNAKEPEKVEKRYLRDALEAVLATKAPPVASTKAFGCSIKFRENS